MFKPVSFFGKIFKWYLLFPHHFFKIRIESVIGKYVFSSGIKIKNSDGVTFKLDANDWITRVMIEEGGYEMESINLAKKILKNGGVFVDIGANFGMYSCYLGYDKNDISIYAIEPNYLVLKRLITNIEINHLEERVNIINAAITDNFQIVFLQSPIATNQGTCFTSITKSTGLAILSCSLEYILAFNSIKVVDLLKIDIEGNEFAVIKKFPFEKFIIKNILIEFSHQGSISLEELRFFFEQRGFELNTIEGKKIIDNCMFINESNIWVTNVAFK